MIDNTEERSAALLRVAAYLGRPQKFMAVADARAKMKRALALAAKGSVVLTTHGEPEAAVVPFATLEDMRRALMHLLLSEMRRSFADSRQRLQARLEEVPTSTEGEMKTLVKDVLHKARHRGARQARRMPRG